MARNQVDEFTAITVNLATEANFQAAIDSIVAEHAPANLDRLTEAATALQGATLAHGTLDSHDRTITLSIPGKPAITLGYLDENTATQVAALANLGGAVKLAKVAGQRLAVLVTADGFPVYGAEFVTAP